MGHTVEALAIELAKMLIETRPAWTSFATARDRHGAACDPCDDRAVAFCGVGALIAAAYRLTGRRDKATEITFAAAETVMAGYAAPRDALRALIDINDAHGFDVTHFLFARASRSVAR